MEVAPAVDDSASAKRRKVVNGELRLSSSKSVRITGCESEDLVNTSESVEKISFSSSDGVIVEKLKCADLEEKMITEIAEIETVVRGDSDRRESKQIKSHILSPNLMAGYTKTPTSESKADSGEKPPPVIGSRRTVQPEKTPPAAELEEFFANAENDLQNRFKDKYNYDVVKDVPLEGRFEWIELKP